MGQGTHTFALPTGHVVTVDTEDRSLVEQHTWCAGSDPVRPYVLTHTRKPSGQRTTISLHRLIVGAERGQQVDHVNGDVLDNRRVNLRLCTRGQNKANSQRRTPGYKGVRQQKNRWRALITVRGQRRHLGSFMTAEDAARAYDIAAAEAWGEFARVNFPPV